MAIGAVFSAWRLRRANRVNRVNHHVLAMAQLNGQLDDVLTDLEYLVTERDREIAELLARLVALRPPGDR